MKTFKAVLPVLFLYNVILGQQVSGGFFHSYILCQDALVQATGRNDYAALGDGTFTNTSAPVQVQLLSDIKKIDASISGGFAVKGDGSLWTWGTTWIESFKKFPTQVVNLSNIKDIAAGYNHSLALAQDSSVWTGGWNNKGQLGNSYSNFEPAFIKINNLTGTVALAAGGYHSLALKKDGTVWAWGANSEGQLGDSSYTNTCLPTQVKNLKGILSIAAGYDYSLALKNDGTVWSWGANLSGQLGNGTFIPSPVPVQVMDLSSVIAISANSGASHSSCLKADGTVWSWGENEDGQLGDGSIATRNLPAAASGLTNIVGIACGGYHSMAIRSDGTIWSWGNNSQGQLGDGTTQASYIPVQVQYTCASNIAAVQDEQESKNTSLDIYPNPASEVLNVNLTSLEDEELAMEITDAMGRIVGSRRLAVSEGGSIISIKELTPGIYFLKLSTGSEQVIERFIKE